MRIFIKTLTEDDYAIDIPTKTIGLNDSDIDKAENSSTWTTYDIDNVALTHYIDNALHYQLHHICMILTVWSVLSKKFLSLTNLQVVPWKDVVSQMGSPSH